jgi:hypothetical protein
VAPTSTALGHRHDDEVDEWEAASAAGDLTSAFENGKQESNSALSEALVEAVDDDMEAVDDMETALSKSDSE